MRAQPATGGGIVYAVLAVMTRLGAIRWLFGVMARAEERLRLRSFRMDEVQRA
jgi:hypothetical protein